MGKNIVEFPQEELLEEQVSPSLETIDLVKEAIKFAIDQKALDVRGLDLMGKSDIADYFILASGTSNRHVSSIVDKIKRGLKNIGEAPIRINGEENAEWVLMDYGDFMVHVFYEPSRQYYDFDSLWSNAKNY